MREGTGEIWDHLGKSIICITTSGSVTASGQAVLGRGCARQAQALFPDLPWRLGALLSEGGNRVHDLGGGLVSFPVEETAWSQPDPRLIARSARELRALADERGWPEVVVPRPGCGAGGLFWGEIRPLLADVLDDRFLLITLP